MDARGLLARQRRGASERVVLVAFAASPLNSVAPNRKKTLTPRVNILLLDRRKATKGLALEMKTKC